MYLGDFMSLYRDSKEIGKATKEWIKNNQELFAYVAKFEQDIIHKNQS
jgi:hypothetical protein